MKARKFVILASLNKVGCVRHIVMVFRDVWWLALT